MSDLKWTRKSTLKIAEHLQQLDMEVCPNTVSRLLYDMGYSLHVNHKTLQSGNKNPPPRPVLNRHFHYIVAGLAFHSTGSPLVLAGWRWLRPPFHNHFSATSIQKTEII